ncbi:uncharacterized protein TNCV_3754601 [Trichonephila clavipes]|nr:uncharacterized protein TNCV_3754601 [Trichonephila clavipes]
MTPFGSASDDCIYELTADKILIIFNNEKNQKKWSKTDSNTMKLSRGLSRVVIIDCKRETRELLATNLTILSLDRLVAAVAKWYTYRFVACLLTSSSPVPLKTRRVGQRCTLNLSRAETSSRWCGVVVRRGGAS